jgi:murein DD-endopeptidase MepM/ murein hydrolase activator NlpD
MRPWLAVIPSAGGLVVSLAALTTSTPSLLAQAAYAQSFTTVTPVQADPWTRPAVQQEVRAEAANSFMVREGALRARVALLARREAAQDEAARDEAARDEAVQDQRQAARAAAALAARQAAAATSAPAAPPAGSTTAAPGCPMHALGAMGRVDEGVDYAGAGPVYALGSGVVTEVNGASGWPGGMFIAYTYGGSYVYVAEDVTAAVSVGEHVSSGTVIGNAYGGGSGIETGWAMPPGTIPEAAAYNHYTDGVPTQEGYNFQSVLRGMGCG